MSALDDVKAGEYVLLALQWDEITSKPGEPLDFVRHRRGDKLTLDVEQARRLVDGGAVAKAGAKQGTPGAKESKAPGQEQSEAPADDTGDSVVTTPVGNPTVVEDPAAPAAARTAVTQPATPVTQPATPVSAAAPVPGGRGRRGGS